MYENRAIYYTEMTKVGAKVELADPHRVYIQGPTKFRAADVVCPPALRPASLLLIGMLAAPRHQYRCAMSTPSTEATKTWPNASTRLARRLPSCMRFSLCL